MLLPYYSDLTMAEAFREAHQHDLRYVPYYGWWERDLATFGWVKVDYERVVDLSALLAKQAVRDVYEAGLHEHYRAAEARLGYNAIRNVVRLAASVPPILTMLDEVEGYDPRAEAAEEG